MRDNDHSFSGGDRDFKIFIAVIGMVEPGKSPFNNPTIEELLPLMWFD